MLETGGQSMNGYTLADDIPWHEDSVGRLVTWKDHKDVNRLADRPVKLHLNPVNA